MPGEIDLEIGRLAVARGFLTSEAIQDCLQSAKSSTPPQNLSQVLLSRGLLTPEQARDLAREVGVTIDSPETPRTGLGLGGRFARYTVLGEIGRGGMGAVYRAHDPVLNRTVALKILGERYLATPDDVHRFQRESKLAARLRHPHLVPVFEAGVHEGIPYYTMEYVEGRTLDEILVDELVLPLKAGVPALSREEKLHLIRKVAEAVHTAHRAGIIHRDLKPANIIVDLAGEPHVMDFGLAKELTSATMLTTTGTAIGTPYYMPPEQARGRVHDLDARTDVYALGAVLYHAVTLKMPFMEETAPMVLRRVLDDDPIPPRQIDPSIDPALDRIIGKAMSKEPVDRYWTAADFAADLQRFLAGQPVAARGPSIARRARKWTSRHPSIAASGAVAALLLLAFAAYFALRPGRLTLRTDPPGAEVWIDDVLLDGRTPLEEVPVPKGPRKLVVRKEGFRAIRLDLDVAGGGLVERTEKLEPQTGTLTLATVPPGAEARLWLGDRGRIERTPIERLALPEGTYQAEFFKPQFQFAYRQLEVVDRADRTSEPVALREALRWSVRTGDGVYLEPAIGRLDDDAVPDIVAGSKDGKVYALSGADGRVIWAYDARNPSQSRPILVDVNLDGRLDVLFGAGTRGFACVNGLDRAPHYFVTTGSRAFLAADAPDADGDGYPDLIAATWDGKLTCHSGRSLLSLKPAAVWSIDAGARPVGYPVVRDGYAWLATEGRRGFRVALSSGTVHSWDFGSPVTDWTIAGETLVAVGAGEATGWTLAGPALLWRQVLRAVPTAVSLSGDVALVSSEEGFLIRLKASDGSEIGRYRADQEIRSRAIVCDPDGDGRPDICFGSGDRLLYVLSAEGAVSWYYLATGSILGPPAARDLDGDGIVEIVFGSDDGRIAAVSAFSRP